MEEHLYWPHEVADKLGYRKRLILEWLRQGKLGGIKLVGRWRIPQSALDAFLGKPSVSPAPDLSESPYPAEFE